jgi:single-stranded DNA-binding protein
VAGAVAAAPPAREVSPEPCATADVRDTVYRALLSALELSPEHREHLLSPVRGMTPEQVDRGMYRTLPEGGRAELGERVARVVDPAGVPGFWRLGGRWRVAGPAGLVVPVRDVRGRVVGLQVRRDDPGGGPRYMWLSSAGRPGGTPARALCHVAWPPGLPCLRVWVTEGPLKADIASGLLGEPVVAVPGVNTWKSCGLLEALQEMCPDEVVLAYDADAETNPFVDRAADELGRALRGSGYRVWLARWPLAAGKGLDDLLLGGGHPVVEEFGVGGGSWMNRVILAGEVLQPPKVQAVKRRDGQSFLRARFLLRVDDDGRREAVPVNAWENQARRLEKAGLEAGDRVLLEGKLKVRREDGPYGQQTSLEIWVSDFEVLLRAAHAAPDAPSGAQPAAADVQPAAAGVPASRELEEVEIPW